MHRHRVLIGCLDGADILARAFDDAFDVVVVDAGASVLRVVDSTGADVVILGASLPDIDGAEVCCRIKRDLARRFTPVVLVAPKQRDNIIAGYAAQVDGFIHTPIVPDIVVAQVNALLQHKAGIDSIVAENERLKSLVTTDQLTGLYNRGYFMDKMDHEVERAKRYKCWLSLIMVDLDNFKSVNDQYGHMFGDLVISEAASVLAGSSRSVDVIARYGGEEFVVLLPQTGAMGAVAAAERMRWMLSVNELNDPNGSGVVHVTASFGVACTPPHTNKSLLYKADQALYQAKRDGRNRVRLYRGLEEPN